MKNNPRTLSKSRFTLAMECPTKLYYSGKKDYANTKGDNDFLMEITGFSELVSSNAEQFFERRPANH